MTEHEPIHDPKEALQSREILIVRFSAVTISGRSGTGKTVVAEKLANQYFIPKNRNIKTGQLMREITHSGQQSQGFMERGMEIDDTIDQMQRDLLINATPDNPLMLEGRLAGVIASEEKQKNKDLSIVSILFVAPSETRMRRVLKRHISENGESILALERQIHEAYVNLSEPQAVYALLLELNEKKAKVINIKTVKENERQRETKDIERWRKLHPQLSGIDPFNPANKDKNGKPIYDLIIETGNLSVDEVAERVHEQLKLRHLIISRDDFGPGNAGGWAYQTVSGGSGCEAYKNIFRQEKCGKISIGTVDVDIRASLELFPYCDEQHAKQLERDLVREITSKGGYTVSSRNGFGRH